MPPHFPDNKDHIRPVAVCQPAILATKACTKCKAIRPLSDYNVNRKRRDGLAAHCKACLKAYNRARWESQRHRLLAQVRNWRENHREHCREFFRDYYRKNPEWVKEVRLKMRTDEACLFKNRARIALRIAVRAGRIIKPDNCQDCGRPTPAPRLHGHHDDHSKPFDVCWVCPVCHGRRHRQPLEAAR